MKTTTPQITVKPDTSKVRRDGTAPIYIYVNWRGRAKQATGVYCRPSDWKSKTMSVSGSPELTRRIRALVDTIERNVDELTSKPEPFTARDVLECHSGDRGRVSILALASMVARDRGLSTRTQDKYIENCRLFERMTDRYMFDLTTDEWRGLAATMKGQGYSLAGIWTALAVWSSMLNYAVDHGIIKTNNLAQWKYKKDGYKAKDNPRALTAEEVELLWEWYEATDCLAGLLWFASYYFNGLAMADLITVDWSNVELKEADGRYWYDGGLIYRRKTNTKVPVICAMSPMCIMPALASTDDLRKREVLEKMKGLTLDKSNKYYNALANNQLKGSPIKGITFYTARHTYCTSLVNARVPLNDIATLMGRSVNTLSTYIRQVSSTEHLVGALSNIK